MHGDDPLPDFDCYRALDIEPWADSATILAAWRAGVAHAGRDATDDRSDDRSGDRSDDRSSAASTVDAARLTVARDWLLDPVRRARYDAVRWPRGDRAPLPDIDPLGSWPERRRRPRPPTAFVPAVAVVALIGWLVALALDPMANPSSVGVLFALSTTFLVAYGGWSLAGLFRAR